MTYRHSLTPIRYKNGEFYSFKFALCLLAVMMTEPVANQLVKVAMNNGDVQCVKANWCDKHPDVGSLNCYADMGGEEHEVAVFLLNQIKKVDSVSYSDKDCIHAAKEKMRRQTEQ